MAGKLSPKSVFLGFVSMEIWTELWTVQSKAKMIQTFLQELVTIVGDPSSVHISIETKR